MDCLRKALVVSPDYVDAMFNLALLLQRKGAYAEAPQNGAPLLGKSQGNSRGHRLPKKG